MKKTTRSTLSLALVLAAGALGAWTGVRAGDLAPGLAWLALFALPGGVVCGALGGLPRALLVPLAWWGLAALADARAPHPLPSLVWAALAWSGLFAAGLALGAFASDRPWSTAGIALLACGALAALPGRAGLDGEPWPPRVARLALDVSPVTLVCESAGLDWMRHRSMYDPVGTDRFQREPWRGSLAGPTALVVGCALCAGAVLHGRRKRRGAREA